MRCGWAVPLGRLTSQSEGKTTRASANESLGTRGTSYTTLPSSFTSTTPSAGPCPHARTLSPGTTSAPDGTGRLTVIVTFSESTPHWPSMKRQLTSPISEYAVTPLATV